MMRGKRFSFTRFMGNAVPNSARDDPNDVDLSPAQADNLLRYQLSQPHPRYLAPNAFYIASITGSEPLSRSVHKALVKAKIVLPAPKEEDGTETMTVNTAGIGRGFASQLAVISVHAQRKLVGLLFFWEEECTRWKLLDEEEAEIRALLDSEGEEMRSNVDLNCALEAVEMKKRMLPSRRTEATANVGAGVGSAEELPSYVGRS